MSGYTTASATLCMHTNHVWWMLQHVHLAWCLRCPVLQRIHPTSLHCVGQCTPWLPARCCCSSRSAGHISAGYMQMCFLTIAWHHRCCASRTWACHLELALHIVHSPASLHPKPHMLDDTAAVCFICRLFLLETRKQKQPCTCHVVPLAPSVRLGSWAQ